MRRLTLCLLGIVALCAGRWRPAPDDVEPINPDPVVPTSTFADPLWPELPVDHGPLPDGLANATAQGCGACHETDSWSNSAHAQPSDAWRDAAANTNDDVRRFEGAVLDHAACVRHTLNERAAGGTKRTTSTRALPADLSIRRRD